MPTLPFWTKLDKVRHGLKYGKRRGPMKLFDLPEDILVMEVFSYLDVEDIISLRRTNVHFYDVSHRAYIWKSFYESMKLPAPALLRNTMLTGPDNDHKYERMVTRAISLDDNWRSNSPKVYNSRTLKLPYNIHEVKLVKGGKYMVAVMSDSYRYFIGVLNLDADHSPNKSPLLARAPTLTKAYDIQAKFMDYKKPVRGTNTTLDIHGLMIMYTMRVPLPGGTNRPAAPRKNGIPADGPAFDPITENDVQQISHLSGEMAEPLRDVNYQCTCLHISTATLESRASYVGPPVILDKRKDILFHDVDTIRCKNPLVETRLFSKQGVPFASALQRPGNSLVFTNLNKREHGSIMCNPHQAFMNSFHRIQNYCVLPEQNEVLVIRRMSRPVDPNWTATYEGQRRDHVLEGHVLELYKIPDITPNMFLNVSSIDDVGPLSALADSFTFPEEWDHIDAPSNSAPDEHGNAPPPPPLVMFMRTKDFTENKKRPRMEMWHIFPKRELAENGSNFNWRYDLRSSVVQQSSREGDHDLKMTMFPGVDRSLLVETYEQKHNVQGPPKVRSFRRYAHPSLLVPSGYQEPLRRADHAEPILHKPRYPRPQHKYCTIPLPADVEYRLAKFGTTAVSWEETIGRACFIYGDDEKGHSRIIQILDFAHDSSRGLARLHAEGRI